MSSRYGLAVDFNAAAGEWLVVADVDLEEGTSGEVKLTTDSEHDAIAFCEAWAAEHPGEKVAVLPDAEAESARRAEDRELQGVMSDLAQLSEREAERGRMMVIRRGGDLQHDSIALVPQDAAEREEFLAATEATGDPAAIEAVRRYRAEFPDGPAPEERPSDG